jgi:hypothetical protein
MASFNISFSFTLAFWTGSKDTGISFTSPRNFGSCFFSNY